MSREIKCRIISAGVSRPTRRHARPFFILLYIFDLRLLSFLSFCFLLLFYYFFLYFFLVFFLICQLDISFEYFIFHFLSPFSLSVFLLTRLFVSFVYSIFFSLFQYYGVLLGDGSLPPDPGRFVSIF